MTLLNRQHSVGFRARRSQRDRARGRRDALIHFNPWVDPLEERTLLSDMTYMVTSSADALSGGTLRQAVILANANPGNNTIAFNLPADSTISLTLGPLVIDPGNAGDGLNIINSGPGAVTMDATGNGPNANNVDEFRALRPSTSTGQIFVIDATAADVQIAGQSASQSITLTNATAIAATDGGAISDVSANVLDVSNVIFTSNTATDGGALYDDNGLVAVNNCTFGTTNLDDNTATSDGGAISYDGSSTLTVDNSQFSDNQAGGGEGGAIYDESIGLTVESSTFTANQGAPDHRWRWRLRRCDLH